MWRGAVRFAATAVLVMIVIFVVVIVPEPFAQPHAQYVFCAQCFLSDMFGRSADHALEPQVDDEPRGQRGQQHGSCSGEDLGQGVGVGGVQDVGVAELREDGRVEAEDVVGEGVYGGGEGGEGVSDVGQATGEGGEVGAFTGQEWRLWGNEARAGVWW